MSGGFRTKKGKDLVKYVAEATDLKVDDCQMILCRFFPNVDTFDDTKLEELSRKSVDDFLKKQLEGGLEKDKVKSFMEDVQRCRQVLGFAQALNYQNYLIINDPVHGTIELHPLLVEIINHPLFQRLRHIKQLGGVSYVYPGATHTRFEHSIGVCHLAGEVMKNLKTKQPELCITERDVLSVEIAGLCHDLGHGPLSHMFEGVAKKICPEWEHEEMSCKVLDEVMKKDNPNIGKFGLDMDFIKNLIQGRFDKENEQKPYRYQIVANKVSGCDVDKWDYIARDCHYLGIPCDFDFKRFIKGTRVAADETGKKELCFRDKEVKNVYGLFHTRGTLHQKAYFHKTSQAIQHMMYEALLKVKDVPLTERQIMLKDIVEKAHKGDLTGWRDFDDRFLLLIMTPKPSKKEEKEPKQMQENEKVFEGLQRGEETPNNSQEGGIPSGVADTDVEGSPNKTDHSESLNAAQTILKQIEERKIYKLIGSIRVKKDQCNYFYKTFKGEDFTKLVRTHRKTTFETTNNLNNLRVLITLISQSSETKRDPTQDPVKKVKFYKKEDPTKTVVIEPEEVSDVTKPTVFSETYLRVYSTDDDGIEDLCSSVTSWAETIKNGGIEVFEKFQRR